MKWIKTVLNYLSLYRYDAAAITLGGCFFGAMSAKRSLPDALDILVCVLVSVVSVNFVYSFNAWADRDIDAINKPGRPIPAGQISARSALIYVMLLLVVAIVYPLSLHRNTQNLLWMLSLPLLGVLYSNPVFPFKKKLLLALFSTCLILTIPICIGYSLYFGVEENNWMLLLIFLYCLCIVPLKDIEDLEGDVAHNSGNWYHYLGEKKLLIFSVLGLALVIFCAWFSLFNEMSQKVGLILIPAVSIITILVFKLRGLDLSKLYKTIIRVVVITGLVFLIITTAYKAWQ